MWEFQLFNGCLLIPPGWEGKHALLLFPTWPPNTSGQKGQEWPFYCWVLVKVLTSHSTPLTSFPRLCHRGGALLSVAKWAWKASHSSQSLLTLYWGISTDIVWRDFITPQQSSKSQLPTYPSLILPQQGLGVLCLGSLFSQCWWMLWVQICVCGGGISLESSDYCVQFFCLLSCQVGDIWSKRKTQRTHHHLCHSSGPKSLASLPSALLPLRVFWCLFCIMLRDLNSTQCDE